MKIASGKLTCLFWVRDELLPACDCSPVWKAVLLYMASFADPDGSHIYHTDRSVAQGVGFARNTVRRALDHWQKENILVKDRPGRSGRGHGPEWRILLPQTGQPVTHFHGETGPPLTRLGGTEGAGNGSMESINGPQTGQPVTHTVTVKETDKRREKKEPLAALAVGPVSPYLTASRKRVTEEFGEDVYLALLDFEKHRKKLRAPLTEKACELILKKLGQFRAQGTDPIAVIEQSIESGWRGLFPLRKERTDGQPKSFNERRSEKSAAAIDKVLGRFEKASRNLQRALPPTRK